MSVEPETPPSPEPNPNLETTPPTEPTTPTEPEKPAEPEKAPEPAPVVALTAEDISLPEGFTMDEGLRDEYLGVMNNPELDAKGRSEALLGLYSKALTAASETNSKAWADTQESWQKEVKEDTEVGGAKFEASMTKVGKLVEEFGTDELRQVFDLTGAGNNIHVVKFLAKISEKLTEGGFTSGNPATGDGSAASKLFPSMKG